MMLMRLFGFAPVPLCGFCPALAACFPLMFSRGVLNCPSFSEELQGLAAAAGCHSGASAAAVFVAFVLLAALACVCSATARGHPDPVGGGCPQSVCAAMLAALRAAPFIFVLLVDGVLLFRPGV